MQLFQLTLNRENKIHSKQNLLLLLHLSEKTRFGDSPYHQPMCFSQLLKLQYSEGSRLKYVGTHNPLVNVIEGHKSHINWLDPSRRWCYPKGRALQPASGAQQLRLVLKLHWHFTKAPDCNTVLHIGKKKGFDRFFLFQSHWRKQK